MSNVIVFGATGAVGRAAAIEANERGAKVWLAMRDTSKNIPGIPSESEGASKFARVQADLLDPASVKKAVETSGAKAAFFYSMFESKDHMRGTIQALKDAGVTWAVFLSSYTVQGNPRDIGPDALIPYHHSTVEVSLEEVGLPFAAVRPGYFASNHYRWKGPLKSGTIHLAYPEVTFDSIDPKNIGQVAGAVLVQPQDIKPTEPQIIYLMGPDLVPQRDIAVAIGKVIGKDVKVNEISEEAWVEQLSKFLPPPVVKYLGESLRKQHEDPEKDVELYKIGKDNVEKYSGKKATTLTEWIEENKEEFLS